MNTVTGLLMVYNWHINGYIGQDKTHFLIFDYCGIFEFFRENPKGMEGKATERLTEKLFNSKVEIIKELQSMEYQTDDISHIVTNSLMMFLQILMRWMMKTSEFTNIYNMFINI